MTGEGSDDQRHVAANRAIESWSPQRGGTTSINLSWKASNRQRRRDRLSDRALPRCRLHGVRTNRHIDRNDDRQLGPDCQHQLQLSRQGTPGGRQAELYSNTATAKTTEHRGHLTAHDAIEPGRHTSIKLKLEGLNR